MNLLLLIIIKNVIVIPNLSGGMTVLISCHSRGSGNLNFESFANKKNLPEFNWKVFLFQSVLNSSLCFAVSQVEFGINLWINSIYHSWERNYFADITDTAHPLNQSFKSDPETTMRNRTIFSKIKKPLIIFHIISFILNSS